MPITDFDSYRLKQRGPKEVIHFTKDSQAIIAGRRSSLWLTAPFGGVAPTTAAVPTSATAGALGQQNGSSLALRTVFAEFSPTAPFTLMLCDRLSHQGALVANLNTTQTTNLPTAALTRYTDGVGVHAGLEIHTIIGTTTTTIATSYTNQAGTGSRTSPLTQIGATGFREVARFIDIPLQQGDVGMRSMESVILTATTGTAGAFGVVLYKPLLHFPLKLEHVLNSFDPLMHLGMLAPEIVDNACLFWLVRPQSAGLFVGQIGFAEDDT